MKKLQTLALTLTSLFIWASVGSAQQKGANKSKASGVEAEHRVKDWSQSNKYFCWDNAQTVGFWSVDYVPGPAFFCVGPYTRRPEYEPMTGKITAVDPRAKTFTVTIQSKIQIKSQPKDLTFSAVKLKTLPTVGTIVDLAQDPKHRVFFSCEECNGVCPGVCFLGPNNCGCYLFHLRTEKPRN